ncbi:1-acyl-sn-glycerol-3-phosphate acyltransferase alpha [Anthophora plagiata]
MTYNYRILSIIYYTTGLVIVLFTLTFLVSCERLRYHLKFSCYIASIFLSTSLHLPFMLLRIRDWRNALVTSWCIIQCCKFLGITYRVRGEENIVKDSGSVLLVNHQSALDMTVMGVLWLLIGKCMAIAKKEILYVGTLGVASWLWGTIFIDRRNSEEAQKILNATAKSIKESKAHILIFPEGHRHSNRTLLPFKKGAFHLAIKSQVPIQPVVVSKYYFLSDKPKRFNSGVSYVTILPPIPTNGLTEEDLPKLLDDTYNVMNKAFLETSEEALNEHMNSMKGD